MTKAGIAQTEIN